MPKPRNRETNNKPYVHRPNKWDGQPHTATPPHRKGKKKVNAFKYAYIGAPRGYLRYYMISMQVTYAKIKLHVTAKKA